MTLTDAERIARRYPQERRPRRTWLWVFVAFSAVGLPWAIWAGLNNANPPVGAKLVGFTVTSDQSIDVTFNVQRHDPSRAARCTVTTQAETYDTVGELPVDIAPSTEKVVQESVTVRTFKRPTSADIENCRLVG